MQYMQRSLYRSCLVQFYFQGNSYARIRSLVEYLPTIDRPKRLHHEVMLYLGPLLLLYDSMGRHAHLETRESFPMGAVIQQ